MPKSAACPLKICDGTGFVVDEATNTASDCACRAQRVSAARSRSLSGVIPPKYRGVSFDRPPVTEIASQTTNVVRRYARRIADNIEAGRGLWIYGDVGTGKTTLAMLASRHALEAGYSVAIYSLPRLLTRIRMTFEDGRGGSYVELMDRLTAVDLLYIDDVGTESTTPWVLEQLYSIVNARYEDERSMIVTTNLNVTDAAAREQLAEQITARTVSRLLEMCEPVPLFGSDARVVYRGDLRSA